MLNLLKSASSRLVALGARYWLFAAAVWFLVIVFLGFYRSLEVGFLSDDYHFLSVASGPFDFVSTWTTNIERTRAGSSYGPILTLAYAAAYRVFGLNAVWYHVVSLAIHALSSWLIFFYAYRLGVRRLVAFLAGTVFALLPGHVEAVSWVASWPHLIATCSALVALLCYDFFLKTRRVRFYLLAVAAFALGILAKEIIITLPGIIVLYNLFFGREKNLKRKILATVKQALPFAIIIFIYLAARNFATGYVVGYYGSSHLAVNFAMMKWTGIELTFAMLFGSPIRQTFTGWLAGHNFLLAVIFFAIVGGVVKYFQENRRAGIYLILSYCVSIVPYLALRLNPHNNEGERYTYFPSIFAVLFFSLAAEVFFSKIGKRANIARIVFLTIVVMFGSFFLLARQEPWRRATNVSDRIISGVANMPLEEKDWVVFVGLPDNIEGAPVMRNAIKEAIFLRFGKVIHGERLPLYTFYNLSDSGRELAKIDEGGGGYGLKPVEAGRRLFTGFSRYRGEMCAAELTNWRRDDTGDGINLRCSLEKHEDFTGNVWMVYDDGREMKSQLVDIVP